MSNQQINAIALDIACSRLADAIARRADTRTVDVIEPKGKTLYVKRTVKANNK